MRPVSKKITAEWCIETDQICYTHSPLMYPTDFRKNTLQDFITKLESDLFLTVTDLTVKDFICSCGAAKVRPSQFGALVPAIPLVPSACWHQAAQPAQAVTPGRLLGRLFGPGIEGQGRRGILLPPMGNEPPTRAVQFQQIIVCPEDHGHRGSRSHIVTRLRPMPAPAVNVQDS